MELCLQQATKVDEEDLFGLESAAECCSVAGLASTG
jgi:hypothetical protein